MLGLAGGAGWWRARLALDFVVASISACVCASFCCGYSAGRCGTARYLNEDNQSFCRTEQRLPPTRLPDLTLLSDFFCILTLVARPRLHLHMNPRHQPLRMMLSDAKLLKRLKQRLAQMAAPLQADARVFQNKITEASERLEVWHGMVWYDMI